MVEPQIVVLDVAGSSPVGHPIFKTEDYPRRLRFFVPSLFKNIFSQKLRFPGFCWEIVKK